MLVFECNKPANPAASPQQIFSVVSSQFGVRARNSFSSSWQDTPDEDARIFELEEQMLEAKSLLEEQEVELAKARDMVKQLEEDKVQQSERAVSRTSQLVN